MKLYLLYGVLMSTALLQGMEPSGEHFSPATVYLAFGAARLVPNMGPSPYSLETNDHEGSIFSTARSHQEPIENRLAANIRAGNEQGVIDAIADGAHANAFLPDGLTPLFLAVMQEQRNQNIIHHLLDAGADVNLKIRNKDFAQQTPTEYIINQERTTSDYSLSRLFVAAGGIAQNPQDYQTMELNPFEISVILGNVKEATQDPQKILASNALLRSILILALSHNRLLIFNFFINQINGLPRTIKEQMVTDLLNVIDDLLLCGQPLLHDDNELKLSKIIVNALIGRDTDETVQNRYVASYQGTLPPSVQTNNQKGDHIFGKNVRQAQVALLNAIKHGHIDNIIHAINAGAPVNGYLKGIKTATVLLDGLTPLHFIMAQNLINPKVIMTLLEAGADPNLMHASNERQWVTFPLATMVIMKREVATGEFSICRLLARAGGDFGKENYATMGLDPLIVAAITGNVNEIQANINRLNANVDNNHVLLEEALIHAMTHYHYKVFALLLEKFNSSINDPARKKAIILHLIKWADILDRRQENSTGIELYAYGTNHQELQFTLRRLLNTLEQ